MNSNLYQIIWNVRLGRWVVTSELAKRGKKRSSARRKALLVPLLSLCSSTGFALPTGSELVSGQASVSSHAAGHLQINQTSQNAVINWQGFSIGQHETVNIQQPNAQAVQLDRVVGADPSVIQGQLQSNGQVYLVNPNGVLFSNTAQVDVGGLVATTHQISDADFNSGKLHFTQNGATGSVVNQGQISVPKGGVVALIGEQVENSGTIHTPQGSTVLAAGNTVDLDMKGDGLVEVKVTAAALNAQITNHGAISADGGLVVLTAQSSGQLLKTVVNNDGLIEARGLVERNGQIVLAAGNNGGVAVGGTLDVSSTAANQTPAANSTAPGGTISVSGAQIQVNSGTVLNADSAQHTQQGHIELMAQNDISLKTGSTLSADNSQGDAGSIHIDSTSGTTLAQGRLSAQSASGKGGHIDVLGAQVGVIDQATINASGANGGGQVLIGGDFQGKNANVHNALASYVGANTVIHADVTSTGDGGKVIVWSDQATRVYGEISAKGGSLSGNGGFIETSGHWLETTGISLDAAAAHGQAGTWLLDPYNLTVVSTGNSTANQSPTATWTAGAGGSNVLNTDIKNLLDQGTNVSLQTSGTTGDGLGNGDITVNGAISTSNNGTVSLTLNANNNIFINANINDLSTHGGALNLNLHPKAGTGTSSIASGVNVGLNGGTLTYNGGLSLAGTLSKASLLGTDTTPLLTSSGGTLDGVTLAANLTETGTLIISNGLTLSNGVIINIGNSQWNFNTSGTELIAMQNGTGSATLNDAGGTLYSGYASGQTLEIGSGVNLQGYGTINWWSYTTAVINNGSILANTTGQTFSISNGAGFTNTGTLGVSAGTLYLDPTSFTGGTGNINLSGGTLNLAGSFTTAALGTFTNSGGAINLTGTLDNTGSTLNIGSTGQFGASGLGNLSGTIKNGTLTDTGATTKLTSTNGTLSGVTIASNLTETGILNISNGLTLANGITINMGNSQWNFNTSGTEHIAMLNGTGAAIINDGGGTFYTGYASGQTLEIDSGVNLQGYGTINWWSYTTAVINNGTILANTTGQTFSISNGAGFTNTGTLGVSAGTLYLDPTSFTGGTGNINLSGGTLNLAGSFTTAALGTFTNTGGAVNLSGTLDNTGSTLNIGSTGQFGASGLGSFSGTIKNGTLTDTGVASTLTSANGTLSGVTIASNLTETGTLNISNGLTLGNGVIINMGNSQWNFNTTGTELIAMQNGTGTATINDAGGTLYTGYASGQTLEIDSGVNLQGYGTINWWSYTTAIINNGSILANTTGQTFSISNGAGFTNTGTLGVSAGTLYLDPTSFTGGTGNINLSGGTLNLAGSFTTAALGTFTNTGGAVNLSGTLDNTGSTLNIGSTGQFGASGLGSFSGTIKNGTLTDTGVASTLTSANGTLSNVTISSNLTETGTLNISNGLTLGNGITINMGNSQWNFNTSGTEFIAMQNGTGAAIINDAGGTWYTGFVNTQTLQIGNGITLQGYGAINWWSYATAVINNGSILANATGQTFNIVNGAAFTNNGTLGVSAGTLNLDPTSFSGTTGNINETGGTLTLAGSFTTLTLGTLTNTGGMVSLSGNLDNSGETLNIGAGGLFGISGLSTLSGTIKNGILTDSDPTAILTCSTGKLDGVTISAIGAAGLNLTESGSLFISNGLTLGNNVTINLGNNTWYFNTTGTEQIATLGAATINIGGGNLYAGYGASAQTLQINSGVSLQGYGQIYDSSAATVVNNGHIIANTNGQTFTITPTTFTNNSALSVTAGTLSISPTTFTNSTGANITAGAGTTLNITASGTFTNAGTVTLGGASHTIGTSTSSWSNTGNIALNSGTLNLGGLLSASQFNSANYSRAVGTSVNVIGVFDISTTTNGIVDIGSAGLFGTGGMNSFSGTIKNGILTDSDATPTLTSSSGTLNAVTIASSLTETGTIYLTNGLTLANAVTINMGNSQWNFNTTGTEHIAMQNGTGTATINNAGGNLYAGYGVSGQTLQIDNGVTLQGYGQLYDSSAATVTNFGTIIANTNAQTFTLNPTTFTNNGSLIASAGVLNINPSTFTNNAGAIISLSGGALSINPSGTAPNWVNNGTFTQSGGTLNLGGKFTAASLGTYHHNSGTVNLTGYFDALGATLNIGSGGLFGSGGLGSLSGTLHNAILTNTDPAAILTSSGGTLDGVTINSSMTETGTLNISNGLTLGNGVTINIGGSQWNFNTTGTEQIAVQNGTGTATINSVGGTIYSGYGVSGQTLQIGSGVTLQGSGSLTYSSAAALINNGTINGNFNLYANSFTNNGTYSGIGTANINNGSGTLTNNGTLAPGITGGDPTGTLAITGNVVMGSGSNVNITLDSTLAGDYSKLTVSGTANLNNATLHLLGLASAGTYAIVNATGGLGNSSFASINAGTFTQTPTYATNTLTIVLGGNSQTSTVTWTGLGGDSNWATAANWSDHLVPTALQNVYIGSGAGTVSVTSGTAESLTTDSNLNLSTGTLTVSGPTIFRGTTAISSNLSTAGPITIGTGGTLNWTAGIINSTLATSLTTQSGSTANVTGGTLGANLSWNNNGTLNLTLPAWTNSGSLNQLAGVLNLNGTFTAANLGSFTRSGGTVNLTGTLNNTSTTVNIGSGGLFGAGGLNSLNGTIQGGTLTDSDATAVLTSSNGTLNGVIVGSSLTETGPLYLSNGLTLGNGVTINMGSDQWNFNTTGTEHIAIQNGTGTAIINNVGGTIYAGGTGGQTLQIDSGITLQGYGQLRDYNAASVVNNGTIIANTNAQTFTINPTTFTNNGSLSATAGTLTISPSTFTNNTGASVSSSAGANLNITPATIFSNTGTVTLGGATQTIGTTNTNWTNTGHITLNTGILNLGGLLSATQLNATNYTRSSGTIVNLTGVFDNSNSTLDIGSHGVFGTGGLGTLTGTIQNGSLTDSDANPTLTSANGTLNGVTIATSLTETGALYLSNGLTLGNGVTVNMGSSQWNFNTTGTEHIAMQNATGSATINDAGGNIYAGGTSGQTLQIDSGVTLQGYGQLYDYYTATVVNNGVIKANTNTQTFTISPTTFTNNGSLSATAGTLTIAPTTFTNSNGASVSSSAGAILNITPNTTFTNAGNIILGGTTQTIGSSNVSWTNTGHISLNAGVLNLGGLLSATQLNTANYSRSSGTSVNLTGVFDIATTANGTLDIGSAGLFGNGGLGTLTGTIKNGILIDSDATPTLTSSNGTLNGVTIATSLTETGALYLSNGLTLGNGVTVNMGSSQWNFNTTGTEHIAMQNGIGAATINDAGGNIYAGTSNQTLQIDNGVTLQGYGQLYDYYTATVVNNGVIKANTSAQTFTINPTTFTNNGSLSATAGTLTIAPTTFTNSNSGTVSSSAGAILNITPNTTFTNAGNITLGGATQTLGSSNVSWTNTGHISLNAGVLNLGGLLSATQLNTANYSRSSGTSVNLTGVFDIATTANGTLDIGSAGLFGTGGLGTLTGTIKNGILTDSDANPTLTSSNGTLNGVTISSSLTETGTLYLSNGLTLANGVTISMGNSTWYFNTTGTEHLAVQNGSGTATINAAGGIIYAGGTSGQTLQIDSGITLQGYGQLNDNYVASVVNNGTIIANTNGQSFFIGPTTFTNNGLLEVTAGTLTINPSNSFTNTGTIEIASGTTLLTQNTNLTNAATGVIKASGSINLGSGTLTNNGTLSTFNAPGYLNLTGNLILNSGSILNATLAGLYKGTGYDAINVSGNITINSGATLNVTEASGFTGATGDAFQLLAAGGTLTGSFSTQNLPTAFNTAVDSANKNLFLRDNTTSTVLVWNSSSSGNWTTPGNWNLNRLPQAGDIVLIDQPNTTFTVTVDSGIQAAAQLISSENLAITAGSLTLTNSAISSATTSINSTGNFSLGGGTFSGSFTNNGTVNLLAGGSGSLTLNGGVTDTGTFTDVTGTTLSFNGNAPLFSGGAAIVGAGTVNFNVTGNLNLPSITAASLQAVTTGSLTQNGVFSALSGGNIVLATGGNYVNNAGAGALNVSSGGRWLLYANSPTNVNKNGLSSAFRQYHTSYNPNVPISATGNGFIYASTPVQLLVNTTLVSGTPSNGYGATPNAVFGYSFANASQADNEDLAAITGSASFTPTISSTTAAGSYTVNYVNGLSSAAGYSFATGSGLAYTVNPALLILTYNAGSYSRQYGQANPVFSGTVTGFLNGDTQASATSGNLIWTTTANQFSNVGSYAITGSGLSSTNYTFVQSPNNAAALTITPATLTYTASTATSIYGANIPGLSGSVTGFVNSDTLATATTGSLIFSTLATNTSNTGLYAINGSGLTANNGNYVFSQAANNATALTINPATLIYTANSASRLYGASNPVIGGTVTGFVNNDTLTNATNGTLTFSSSATNLSNVGSYTITGSGLTANNGNYIFSQAANNASALTINPAALSITANAASITYNGLTYSGGNGVTYSGLVNNETGSVLSGSLFYSGSSQGANNAGSYVITPGGLSSGNYTITYTNGSLTITPATLTATGSQIYDAGRVFQGSNLVINGVNGETFTASGSGLVSSKNVQANEALVSIDSLLLHAVNGDQLSNYTTLSTANTSVSITPLALTGSINAGSSIYGATLTPGAVTFSSNPLTGDNLGTISVTVNTSGHINPNNHQVNVGSYTESVSASSADAANYSFAGISGDYTVTPATLSYIANPATSASGAPVPVLSGTVSGFVTGDNLSNATTGTLSFTTSATSSSNIGSYAISGSGLNADFGNYLFAQAASNANALTITPATDNPNNLTNTPAPDNTPPKQTGDATQPTIQTTNTNNISPLVISLANPTIFSFSGVSGTPSPNSSAIIDTTPGFSGNTPSSPYAPLPGAQPGSASTSGTGGFQSSASFGIVGQNFIPVSFSPDEYHTELVVPAFAIKNSAPPVTSLEMSADRNSLTLLLADGELRVWDFDAGLQRLLNPGSSEDEISDDATRNKAASAQFDKVGNSLTGIGNTGSLEFDGTCASPSDPACNVTTTPSSSSPTPTGNPNGIGTRGLSMQDFMREINGDKPAIDTTQLKHFSRSVNGELMLGSATDNQLSLWDSLQSKKQWHLSYQRGEVNSLAMTKNNRYGAVLSQQPGSMALNPGLQVQHLTDAVDIVDLASGKVIHSIPNLGEHVIYMEFTNEDTLQLGLANGDIVTWAVSAQQMATKAHLADAIKAVDAYQDSYAYILPDGTVQISNGKDQPKLSIQNQENPFKYAKLIQGNEKLLTMMENGEMSLWDVNSATKLLRMFSSKKGWTVMDAFGRFDGSEEALENFSWEAEKYHIPLDSFSENFYEPGLLSNVLRNHDYINQHATMVKNGITLPPKVELQLAQQQASGSNVALQLDVFDRGGGIAKINIYHNGKLLSNDSVVTAQQVQQVNNSIEHRLMALNINPTPGKNSLKVTASNLMGIETNSSEVSFDGATKTYTSAVRLLTVGIDKYSDPKLNLNYSVADAQLIGTGAAKTASVVSNKNLYNDKATKANILAELKELSQGEQQDNLIIYFAGHGVAIGKEWYFLPYETKIQPTVEAMAAHGVSATELSDIFKSSKMQHILVMIDSCYSGASTDAFEKLQTGQHYFTRQLSRSLGITMITAASKDKEAYELQSLGHGLFTYLMAEDLQIPGINHTAHSIAENIVKTLPAFSKKMVGDVQEPAVYIKGNDFMLTDVTKAGTTSGTPAAGTIVK